MAFDLDALIAEAEGEPFAFVFGGVEFTWAGSIDYRVTDLLGEGKLFEALERLNGDQHEKFTATWEAHPGVLSSKVVYGLFGEHAKHAGSSLGESSASAVSSKSTARPPKQTSKRTTG